MFCTRREKSHVPAQPWEEPEGWGESTSCSHWKKKTLYCFIFTFSWHCTWKGWPEPGRAELRDSRSSAKSGVGASFAKEEAKGYLISAAAAQKVLTDRSKILFWETVAITRSNAQFAAWEIKMIYWKTSLLGSNAALEHDQRCIKISRFRLCQTKPRLTWPSAGSGPVSRGRLDLDPAIKFPNKPTSYIAIFSSTLFALFLILSQFFFLIPSSHFRKEKESL